MCERECEDLGQSEKQVFADSSREAFLWSDACAQHMIVLGYVFHLLRIYVILLCNWLILWQNTLYLYLDRSRMCLILQETCCSSLVLKPWRLDQETSEEKLFIKAWQIARHLRTNSSTAARQLVDRLRKLLSPRQLLDSFLIAVSIEV